MRVALQFGFRQKLEPVCAISRNVIFAYAGVDRSMRRKIAGEVTRVNIESVYNAGNAEFHDAKVMSRLSFSSAFPAIHPLAVFVVLVRNKHGIGGIDEPGLIGEKVVACEDDLCTEPGLLEAHPLMKWIFDLIVQTFSS